MSTSEELKAFLGANIACGDVSEKTIERMKSDIVAVELEEEALRIPFCEKTFFRAA